MNFGLSDLEALVALAELTSFRKAAESVHLSQPALSRRIAKLEGVLGVRLFDRTTRFVGPTAVGREFAAKARGLLDELGESLLVMKDVAAARTGERSEEPRLNSSHQIISYAVFCLKKKKQRNHVVELLAHPRAVPSGSVAAPVAIGCGLI